MDYTDIRNYVQSLERRSNRKFFEETRVSRSAFNTVLRIVENYSFNNPSITIPYGSKYALHACLHYLGNSMAYRVTAETLGIPRSAACHMTSIVVDALVQAVPDWIKWPTVEEQDGISRIFEYKTNFLIMALQL